MTQVIPRESKRITYSSEIRALKLVPFTPEQLSIVNGSMLGDGCLHEAWPGTSKNYVFSKMHSIKQQAYLEWIHEKLKPFTRNPLRLYEPTQSLRLRTIGHSTFTALRAIFYPNGRKVLPETIADIMADPLSIAVWFMDDGNAGKDKGKLVAYYLNTQSFNRVENELIRKIFARLHGIHACIVLNHGYYRIAIFQRESREKFRDLVKRHIVPSMQYKLG